MRWLLLPLVLAGCNAPHPFSDLPTRAEAAAGGFTFVINHSHLEAEVIRTNTVWRPQIAAVHRAALSAVRDATGCAPIPGTFEGDVALMYVEIDCDASDRPAPEVSCGLFGQDIGTDVFEIELDCKRKGQGRAYRRGNIL